MHGTTLTPEQVAKLIGLGGQAVPPAPREQPMQARVLTDMLPTIQRICPFKAGDIVQQAKGRGVFHFHPDTLFLVTHIYGPEVTIKARDGSHWPREDILVAVVVPCPNNSGDEHWRELAAESWRFEAYDGEVA